MKLANHSLRTADVHKSLAFYQLTLGMKLVGQQLDGERQSYFLAFDSEEAATLEIVFEPGVPLSVSPQPSRTEGYWKFAISVPDLALARQNIIDKGTPVGECTLVPGVAFLCHLQDPDGYCIELIQHHLDHVVPAEDNRQYLLGTKPSFNLSTLRVKNIDASLAFYTALGMTLVSKLHVGARNMTLYFLAPPDTQPASPQLDAVENCDWMWQRPYTLLELQHIHGTEIRDDFHYHTGITGGFLGLDFEVGDLSLAEQYADKKSTDIYTPSGKKSGITLYDPDGYRLRCYLDT
ncbi:VOC family protein [Thalassomonas viridans]|uniref:VOC family protein n=1 Tax=Thalassomonas viridans TaxID=137584 RepID=A0AAE9ZB69_9GAMM|nr:VOC family protein [Thalassomonas viridans]WDE09019.1 VOC family protein [Thalassomonas viridans]